MTALRIVFLLPTRSDLWGFVAVARQCWLRDAPRSLLVGDDLSLCFLAVLRAPSPSLIDVGLFVDFRAVLSHPLAWGDGLASSWFWDQIWGCSRFAFGRLRCYVMFLCRLGFFLLLVLYGFARQGASLLIEPMRSSLFDFSFASAAVCGFVYVALVLLDLDGSQLSLERGARALLFLVSQSLELVYLFVRCVPWAVFDTVVWFRKFVIINLLENGLQFVWQLLTVVAVKAY